ncbi:MAG: Acetolactate synthase large subunit [Actinomycetospora sp.]|nr:Acetolactate synthase large subunit [Actinomycetospora sp.]
MRASDLFVKCLEAEGVEYVFGVPGEENADLLMSMRESSVKFVPTHHESGGAFMADVYGRLTGQAGVCLSTLGPGAANLVTGVANANMDNSPVVAITGQGATTRLHKESHQAMNVNDMFAPLTKWTSSLRDESTIPEVIRKAFKLAVAEKPGATHVELPEDIAKHEVESAPIVPPEKVRRPIPDEKSIAAALDLIARAERPVLLVGQGCVRTRVSRQLQRFVEKTGIYAGMTFMGKGALSDRHERSLYAVGLGSRDYVTEVFEAADLVIAVGYDMVEWPPGRWNIGRTKRLLHIDFDPAEVDTSYRPTVEMVGDVAATLWAINEGLTDAHRFPDFEGHARARRNLTDEINDAGAAAERETGDFPMKPQRILADLRAEMDDEDVLISDVGAHKMWLLLHGDRGARERVGVAGRRGPPDRRHLRRRRLPHARRGAGHGHPPRRGPGQPGLGGQRLRPDLLEAGGRVRPPLRHRVQDPRPREDLGGSGLPRAAAGRRRRAAAGAQGGLRPSRQAVGDRGAGGLLGKRQTDQAPRPADRAVVARGALTCTADGAASTWASRSVREAG